MPTNEYEILKYLHDTLGILKGKKIAQGFKVFEDQLTVSYTRAANILNVAREHFLHSQNRSFRLENLNL